MNLIVSGEKKTFADGITVRELIQIENVETPEYVTVSLNDEFVEKTAFGSTLLKDGDAVEFIYFMGGGLLKWH